MNAHNRFNLPPENSDIELLNNRFFTWYSEILHPQSSHISTLQLTDNGDVVAPVYPSLRDDEPSITMLQVSLRGTSINDCVWSMSLARSGERLDFEYGGVTRYDMGEQNSLISFYRCNPDEVKDLTALLVEAVWHPHTIELLEKQKSTRELLREKIAQSQAMVSHDDTRHQAIKRCQEIAHLKQSSVLPPANVERLDTKSCRTNGLRLIDIFAT